MPMPLDFSISNLLNSIPAEFTLYVRGAAAYRAEDAETAAARWKELLRFARGGTSVRSVSAALCSARRTMTPIPPNRYGILRRRELAAAGLHDSLRRVTDSLAGRRMWP